MAIPFACSAPVGKPGFPPPQRKLKRLWICLPNWGILNRHKHSSIMSQAIMDPEKVRRFAEELQRFNAEIENRMILLHARFVALGDTWSDQEHEKFADEFKQTMKTLKKFTDLSHEQIPFLLRKAQRIEEYLHQR